MVLFFLLFLIMRLTRDAKLQEQQEVSEHQASSSFFVILSRKMRMDACQDLSSHGDPST